MVTGGGTAGHVLPALAVAESLVAVGHDPTEIHYVGAERGIETRLVPETAHPSTFLDVVGFQRRVDRRNLGFVPKMLRARRRAIELLTELEPRVVVSVGGYASMPAVFAARKLGIPIVVVSYDRRPGRASQLSARNAAACAVAFEGSTLPRATLTGAPVRQAILDVDRTAFRQTARARLGIPDDRFLIAVMGGSLGSGVLNSSIGRYVHEHRDDRGLAVRHVAGERFLESVDRIDEPAGIMHQVVGYEDDMPSLYAAADVFVGRGGASTVHEVAVTGIPAVLVPWPGAAEDHQRANVEWLSDVGGAILLDEGDIERLGAILDDLRADPTTRDALSAAARERGELHRSGALARLIERAAVTSSPS